MKPPKTTGRELFGVQMGERINQIRMSLNISDASYVCTVDAPDRRDNRPGLSGFFLR
jgi:hypothetical protein